MKRPEYVTDDHLNYLDELRDSAEVNMYGAVPYLADEYPELTYDQATQVWKYWKQSFTMRHPL